MSRTWLSFTPNSVPIVPVRMGGRRYEAMIDTGSFISMISPELSVRLGLPRHGQQRVVSVHGDIRTRHLVTLPPTGVADLEIVSCNAVISDLTPLRGGLNLLLGVNAFTNRHLHVDFREGRVYLLG